MIFLLIVDETNNEAEGTGGLIKATLRKPPKNMFCNIPSQPQIIAQSLSSVRLDANVPAHRI